jgi:O-antigen/teichoic acid export membrane protein
MGLYAIVFMAGMALDMLPQAVLQVMYPRMAEQYGRTGRLHDLLRMARKPILFTTIGMIPTIAVAWWLAEPSIRLLVPAYVGAIAAVRWRVIDSLLTCFQPVNHVFNVVRRQDLYLVAIVLGMAAYLGSLKWLIRDGVSLAAFPQAMLIGRVVFVAASYAFVGYLKNREPLHGG